MPLSIKTFTDFFRTISGKFQKELPSVDPTIQSSLTRSSAVGAATAGASLQEGLQDAVDQIFWQTADDDFLELIGEYDETIRFSAQPAKGLCSVEGVVSTLIPAGTQLNRNGITYQTLSGSSVTAYNDTISLSISAGIVTAITASTHSLATGLSVTITGATQTGYNGTFVITVIDGNTFTYEVEGSFTTDNGQYSSNFAILDVQSTTSGSDTNVESGGPLTIDVINVEDTAYTHVSGIVGGLDQETIEDYRIRVGEAHTITPGISTTASIVFSAKKIPGNTRIFIVRPIFGVTGGVQGQPGYLPQPGEAIAYVLRDQDPNIIPNQQILDATKQQILEDGNWPTFLPDGLLYVFAPILKQQDFIFSSISPNTTTMQNSIREQLAIFFEDNADIQGTILLDDIKSFLRQVQDSVTGQFLEAYVLTTPSTDIVAASGEIYTVGSVTYG